MVLGWLIWVVWWMDGWGRSGAGGRLQSLGQDYMEDMTTHTSNAVFIVMWPIFNILLVNLLVAGVPFPLLIHLIPIPISCLAWA